MLLILAIVILVIGVAVQLYLMVKSGETTEMPSTPEMTDQSPK